MVYLLQRYNTELKVRSAIEQLIDSPSGPASAANAAVPHLLCCLNTLRQSKRKKRKITEEKRKGICR